MHTLLDAGLQGALSTPHRARKRARKLAPPQEFAQYIPLGSDTETSSGAARDQAADYDVDHGIEDVSYTDNDACAPEVSCGQQESWQSQGFAQSPAHTPAQDQSQVGRPLACLMCYQ